jgi:hypothetical protein
MTKLTYLPCVALLALGSAACGGNDTAGQEEPTAATLNDTAATSGDAGAGDAGANEASEPLVNAVPPDQERDTLPSTASPLVLAGLVGAVSLGGAIGLRLVRRR